MSSYKDLEIYQKAYDLALEIHRFSLMLPKFELYEEGSQIRRASKSVCSNIVEGYGRKRYKAEFIRFLIFAHASCDETILHLNMINDTHKFDKINIHEIIDKYHELSKRINVFIQYVDNNWKT